MVSSRSLLGVVGNLESNPCCLAALLATLSKRHLYQLSLYPKWSGRVPKTQNSIENEGIFTIICNFDRFLNCF